MIVLMTSHRQRHVSLLFFYTLIVIEVDLTMYTWFRLGLTLIFGLFPPDCDYPKLQLILQIAHFINMKYSQIYLNHLVSLHDTKPGCPKLVWFTIVLVCCLLSLDPSLRATSTIGKEIDLSNNRQTANLQLQNFLVFCVLV